jgi:hypothetical protein
MADFEINLIQPTALNVDLEEPTTMGIAIDNVVKIQPTTEDVTVKSTETQQEILPTNTDLISKVIVSPMVVQEKTITPTESKQEIVADNNYDYLKKVTINAVSTEQKTITPTKNQQVVTPTSGKFINQVIVNPIPSNYVDYIGTTAIPSDVLSGKKFIAPDGNLYNGTLVEKTLQNIKVIIANGYYQASDDSVDGYANIQVDVPDESIEIISAMMQNTLVTFEIPEGVTQLRNYALYYLNNLVNLILPSTLTRINQYSCAYLSKLEQITFNKNLYFFSAYAFRNCTSLTTIKCLRDIPPTIQSTTFNGCTALTRIEVPLISLSTYQSASNWSAYADIMVGV